MWALQVARTAVRVVMLLRQPRWAIWSIVCAGALVTATWTAEARIRPHQVAGDEGQIVAIGYNLAKYGTMSFARQAQKVNSTPTAYREPLLPWIVSAHVLSDDEMIRTKNWKDFQKRSAASFVPWMLGHQVFLMCVTMLLCGVVATVLGGSPWAAPLAMWLFAGSSMLTKLPSRLLAGCLATFLLTAVCCAGLWAVRSRKIAVFVLWGALLGLLAQTKAMFAYAPLACLPALAYYAWRSGWHWRQTSKVSLAMLLAFGCVVGPWMYRNHHQLGRFYITDRGGAVLSIRAQYDQMTPKEYRAAWLYWSGFSSAQEMLKARFKPREYERLDRDNSDGYYRQGRTAVKGDAKLLKGAKAEILAHPWKHLKMTPLFAWRAVFAEKRMSLGPIELDPAATPLLAVLCFLGFGLLGFRRRSLDWLILLTPALFVWLAYALLSHNITRYSHILLPAWYAALAAFVTWVARLATARPHASATVPAVVPETSIPETEPLPESAAPVHAAHDVVDVDARQVME